MDGQCEALLLRLLQHHNIPLVGGLASYMAWLASLPCPALAPVLHLQNFKRGKDNLPCPAIATTGVGLGIGILQ